MEKHPMSGYVFGTKRLFHFKENISVESNIGCVNNFTVKPCIPNHQPPAFYIYRNHKKLYIPRF